MEITGSVQMQASIFALKESSDAPAQQAEHLLAQAVQMSKDMMAQAASSAAKAPARGIDLRA